MHARLRRWRLVCVAAVIVFAGAALGGIGCELISNRLSKWKMLDQKTMEDPIRAVGGDAIVFSPSEEKSVRADKLASATPAELVTFYAPILVQQRVNTTAQRRPYPPEYDLIGSAQLKRDAKGALKSTVGGEPAVYAIYQTVAIGEPIPSLRGIGRDSPTGPANRVQLTYTAWYPAHPKMKAFDLEEADIDSCVLRVTLDDRNGPILYETIAACGCFHKAFVEKWIEEESARQYGTPEKGKKYSVERTVKGDVDWEVAGIVDEPRNQPGRPVVFLKAGDHKVMGLGSTARLKVPAGADNRRYALADYQDLYAVPTENGQTAPFFDTGGKVRGAERKERFIFSVIGVDSAGQPRANDQIKLHFDQSTWSDPTIYGRFLRLPPGTL
jgi:hypothetical protein